MQTNGTRNGGKSVDFVGLMRVSQEQCKLNKPEKMGRRVTQSTTKKRCPV